MFSFLRPSIHPDGKKENPDDINDNHDRTKSPLRVLSLPLAMIRLGTADWLTKNDQSDVNAKQNFTDENVNLSLVCALLFTSFLPIFYNESASMNDPTTGLALDIEMSWLSQMNYQYLSTAFIHDMFLFFYALAMGNACLGTLLSIFYTLSAAQCEDDNKTVVLMNILGFCSRLPYLFFATGIIMWGCTAYLKIILTAQTVYGFTLILAGWVVMCSLIMIAALMNVRGIYAAYDLEEIHHPINLGEKEIDEAMISYFHDTNPNDITLNGFLRSLTYHVDYGYRVPLSLIAETMAKKKFYMKLAERSQCTFDELMQMMTVSGRVDRC